MKALSGMVCALLLIALIIPGPSSTASAACNPMELAVCMGSIMGSSPPSQACCDKLREQTPCFCQYTRNPALSQYFKNKNAKKVSDACKVPFPASCPHQEGAALPPAAEEND